MNPTGTHRRTKRWTLLLGAGSACVAISAATAAATPLRAASSVSSNWAGYAISGGSASSGAAQPTAFSDVTASWVEPKASCTAGKETSSAFWVGLGGLSVSSQGLEQIGTEADCSAAGTSTHNAWYELVPAPSVDIHLEIAAGDTITAAVVASGSKVTLQITNVTRKARFTKVVTAAAPDVSSAEWIAEAPSVCNAAGDCRPVPLTDFGRISFTRAAAVGSGHAGVISDPAWTATRIALVQDGAGRSFRRFDGGNAGGTSSAVPAGLAADGRAFSISWQQRVAGR